VRPKRTILGSPDNVSEKHTQVVLVTYNWRILIEFQFRDTLIDLFEETLQVRRLDINFGTTNYALLANDAAYDERGFAEAVRLWDDLGCFDEVNLAVFPAVSLRENCFSIHVCS
jgi:hypothetical protein